ncbi:MAG: TetR/AcrR family transcriptional regulator, partial [Bacilli bacterium]
MDVDLRIRKSKHHLRKSIITLLKKVPFSDINISMICKEANVSRVTFYNYYSNKNELIEDIVRILLNSTIKKTHIETGTNKIDICYFKCLLINIVEISY